MGVGQMDRPVRSASSNRDDGGQAAWAAAVRARNNRAPSHPAAMRSTNQQSQKNLIKRPANTASTGFGGAKSNQGGAIKGGPGVSALVS